MTAPTRSVPDADELPPSLREHSPAAIVESRFFIDDDIVGFVVEVSTPATRDEDRDGEAALLSMCEERPQCRRIRVAGHDARLTALGDRHTLVAFVEPGLTVTVGGPAGRVEAFAEAIDWACLPSLVP